MCNGSNSGEAGKGNADKGTPGKGGAGKGKAGMGKAGEGGPRAGREAEGVPKERDERLLRRPCRRVALHAYRNWVALWGTHEGVKGHHLGGTALGLFGACVAKQRLQRPRPQWHRVLYLQATQAILHNSLCMPPRPMLHVHE